MYGSMTILEAELNHTTMCKCPHFIQCDEEGKGDLVELMCTSGVDSHDRLPEGRELSGEGVRT